MELVHLFTVLPGTNNEKKYYFNTDTLLEKNKEVSVSVRPAETYSDTYHPARVTYTGITIGGFHTGSINVKDEYYTFSSSKTGLGKVMINGLEPEFIQLNENLLKMAKQDPVLSAKLCGNKLRLRGAGMRVNEGQMLDMLRGNDISGRTAYLNSQSQACYSMQFCMRAADFIANALDGKFLTEKQRQGAAEKLIENHKAETILVGELLNGYDSPKSKNLLQQTIDILLDSKNAEHWYIVKQYLEKNGGEGEKNLIKKIDKKLLSQTKYEIDGKIFYDKKRYDDYVLQKEMKRKEIKTKIEVAIISTLCILFIGGCGLIVLLAMGII